MLMTRVMNRRVIIMSVVASMLIVMVMSMKAVFVAVDRESMSYSIREGF